MQTISDLIKQKRESLQNQPRGRNIAEWQVWALEFCKQYNIPPKEKGTVMATAKRYADKIDYLRYISGWMSDYPNLEGGTACVRLLLWKLKKDRTDNEESKKDKLVYM